MNQKHVPDLELCQELDRLCKEKNITLPETEYIWLKWKHHEEPWLLSKSEEAFYQEQGAKKPEWTIPAPLASEQGECLPVSVQISWHKEGEWVCETFGARAWYEDGGNYPPKAPSFKSNTEANARQKMINHLIAEGIITKL